MWNRKPAQICSAPVIAEPAHSLPAVNALKLVQSHAASSMGQAAHPAPPSADGEILESNLMVIDGIAEGHFRLPGSRILIGRNAQVNADIVACDVVVFGSLCGNIAASGRVEIRVGASLVGDVAAARVCIEEGVILHGSVETVAAKPRARRATRSTPRTLLTMPDLTPWQSGLLEPVSV